jgi:predicted CoA-binding protein
MQPVDGLHLAAGPVRGRAAREDRELVAEHLDLEAGRLGFPVLDDAQIADVLRRARRIAVIGASADPSRPSHGVLVGLIAAGYDVVPVNPSEDRIEGLSCFPTLGAAVEATGRVDIVDVFRRREACPAHAREAVAAGAGCLWLQLGLASREAGRIAHEGGLMVVMDRCTLIELARIRRT